ncbi:MAG: HEAT repeat domain-containing protein, partial [Sandaracinaceae bacterium]
MSDQGSAARSSSPEAAAAPSFAERLKTGVGGDDARLRASLELAADADDTAFARALVEATAKRGLADIAIDREAISEPPAEAPPPAGADSSFLGRLSVAAEQGSERPGVDELEDVHTLLAVVRAGTLAQRRAAVLRLGSLLHLGKPTNEEVRSIATSLLGSRDVEIAFEVGRAREALPGARGREARQERESFDALIPRVIAAIDDFWSGQSNEDPIRALPPEDLAQLMVRLRDAPEAVVAHIASVIDGSDGVGDRDARRAMLSSVRLSGDPRLVPTLVGILESRVELGTDAARALARIEDPRVPAALARAYDRSVVDAERAVLAGALGIAGDTRARDYVRPLLGSDDERVLFVAVRAMEALATAEDTERLTPLLTRSDPVLLSHVIRALGRSGDPRALPPLLELRSNTSLAALFGDIDDAEATIAATMELRGEERPEATESFALQRATATGMAQRERDPIVVRL